MKLLDRIKSPSDLKLLSLSDLKNLSGEIRELIINVLSVNGGHLASNLGAVELTLALHRVFDSPKDKILFDTTHQIYAHKIVTGRRDLFPSIRTYQGLSGFAAPQESPHDLFAAGHAGTALSQALGLAKRRDLLHLNETIIPILSDAPLACGLTLEALNQIPTDLQKFIILLNDNAMAISDGVGTIHSQILGKFALPRTTKQEARFFFEQFGLIYQGPVDGHDLEALIPALEEAKKQAKPVLLHLLTIKGHGMPKAVQDPITYHGVKPFDPESGKFHPVSSPKPTFPKVFGKWMLKKAEEDPSLVAITPAMSTGSCLTGMMERYPDRCLDVGIAEGHAVTFGGALAYKSSLKVVTSIYATFFQRALDNLFQDVCLQNIPVIFALDRAGFSPQDGSTHHGIYDIGFMQGMPGLVIAQPRNGDLLKDLLSSSFSWKRPSAIRYPNMTTEESERDSIYRPCGKGELLLQGKEILLLPLGHMAECAFDVAALLEESGYSPSIFDPIFVKPLDTHALKELALTHTLFVTIEEHASSSGFGMAINAFIAQEGETGVEVMNFGIPDRFIEHGNYRDLMAESGLLPFQIAKKIQEKLSQLKALYSPQEAKEVYV